MKYKEAEEMSHDPNSKITSETLKPLDLFTHSHRRHFHVTEIILST